jgi:SNF2 family DNA or RNA helicase
MKLKPILVKLMKENHRVLVFSQMTKVLDILELFLAQLKYEYVRLDGSTPVEDRQGLIDLFNTNKEIPLFLLSTKAGGVGINLNTADTVIFFDLSFNYQVDRQAEDRCHRIGNEEKQVKIMKVACWGFMGINWD